MCRSLLPGGPRFLRPLVEALIILGMPAAVRAASRPDLRLPDLALPSPNAFDDFDAAARAVVDADAIALVAAGRPTPARPRGFTLDDRLGLVRENAVAMGRLRDGLHHPAKSPALANAARDGIASPAETARLSSYRSLARLLAIEGDVRSARGDPAGAVSSRLDAVEFGEDMTRGSPIIDRLVGDAVEAIGRRGLPEESDHLTALQARRAVVRLESILDRHVPFSETLRAERFIVEKVPVFPGPESSSGPRNILQRVADWVRRRIAAGSASYANRRMQGPLSSYMADRIAYLRVHPRYAESAFVAPRVASASPLIPIMAPVYQAAWFHERAGYAQSALMLFGLALRAYRVERGRYPGSLAELAPGVLRRLPDDPFAASGGLRYRRSGPGFVLYSVGPDGRDDGGRPIAEPVRGRRGPISRRPGENSHGDIVYRINRG